MKNSAISESSQVKQTRHNLSNITDTNIDNRIWGKGGFSVLLIIISLLLLIPVLLSGYVGAQGGGDGNETINESLQEELNNLTSNLTAEGYEWLVNYSILTLNLNTKNSIYLY